MNGATAAVIEAPSQPSDPNGERQYLVLFSIGLALLVVALYLPALHNGFVNYDDPEYVTHNAQVLQGLNWQSVKWAFGTQGTAANWHPLTWLSHMADVQVFGLSPWGHHLVNILLMAADTVLLFLFLFSATGKLWRSAAVAALFAVHPLNVEPVAWIAERKQVLCLCFLFLALIAYSRYAKRPNAARYLMVVLFFALALMAKVIAIILPFAFLLLDYWPLERFSRRSDDAAGTFWNSLLVLIREKIPLFLMTAVATWINLHAQSSEGAVAVAMPFVWRLKNAVYAYAMYLGKMLWPARLAVFYPHPQNHLALWQVVVAAVVLLAISAFVWRHRSQKYLATGWLWYLGTAFPTIGIVQAGRQGMADRYAQLPLIGIFVALVWFVADAFAREPKRKLSPAIAGATCATVLLALALVAHRQIAYWQDSETLFTHALQVTTHNGTAENNLGVALMEKGDIGGAFPHFLAAVQYSPDLGNAHYNFAVLLQRQGHLPEAANEYRLAIAHAGGVQESAQAHNNLGVIYLSLNNLPLAITEFNQALALNPNEVNSYVARGTVEFRLGKLDDAIADFTQAASRSRSPLALYWLGRAEEAKGDFSRAKGAYQAALQLAPNLQEARTQLESLRALTGQ
ncbi:MAG TPA: tetratricopeptide repeat protein [Verrucomicrobiae bacterium]|nr:tetratricopeptide repeat protein [Verrucomicrobiae bacterium]